MPSVAIDDTAERTVSAQSDFLAVSKVDLSACMSPDTKLTYLWTQKSGPTFTVPSFTNTKVPCPTTRTLPLPLPLPLPLRLPLRFTLPYPTLPYPTLPYLILGKAGDPQELSPRKPGTVEEG